MTAPLLLPALRSLDPGQFCGVFELHLTVPSLDRQAEGRFVEASRALGLKPILIEAPGAQMTLQPMTSSYHRGSLGQVLGEASQLIEGLSGRGFEVLRCKLEASLNAAGVPRDEAEARGAVAGQYFEFHAKVVLGPGDPIEPLRERCASLGARLSSNAFRVNPEGQQERFLTVRAHGVGRQEALEVFRKTLSSLRQSGYTPRHLLHEYSVLDTSAWLDHGW